MLEWDYERGFAELKYEEVVTKEGHNVFGSEIEQWELSNSETKLLTALFAHHSVFGPGGKKHVHVRDPRSKQFEEHFTDNVSRKFNDLFPGAVERLGYQ